jgi:hypothetical protein
MFNVQIQRLGWLFAQTNGMVVMGNNLLRRLFFLSSHIMSMTTYGFNECYARLNVFRKGHGEKFQNLVVNCG